MYRTRPLWTTRVVQQVADNQGIGAPKRNRSKDCAAPLEDSLEATKEEADLDPQEMVPGS
jgi:hypothetical protein